MFSILAVLVAGASAAYTRRQALANERTEAIETDRRHAELTPVLQLEYVPAERMHEQERPGVWVSNRGPLDLERVVVEMVPPPRADEAVIDGIYDPRTHGTASNQETGRLRRGDTWTAMRCLR